jgi:signal transduction histidine kinase/CheY-like chemotaxis protein
VSIHLALPDGTPVMNSLDAAGRPLPLPDAATVTQTAASRTPTISDLIMRGFTGQPSFGVRVPVLRDGTVTYVLSAQISARSMAAALRTQHDLPDRIAVLYDRNGVIVYRTLNAERLIGTPVTPRLAERSAEVARGILDDVNREGTPVRTAFQRSALSGWRMAVGTPHHVLYAAQRRSMWTVLGVGAAVIVVSAMCAMVVERRIRRSVVALVGTADALTGPGPGHPRPVVDTPITELGRLGHALNAAGELIRARGASLERQVRELQRAEADRMAALDRERVAREAAEAANRAKDEFLAVLGHELRNPLAAITTAVRLLDVIGRQDDTTVRAREVIGRQAQHLARLVGDLTEANRVVTGKVRLDRRPVDLGDAARRCATTVSGTGRLERHIFKVEVEPGCWVNADPLRLDQVVTNLLDNAAKYTPPGGSIFLSVNRRAHEAVLAVRDTGIGMPADLLSRVFDLFVQGDPHSGRAKGGLGIGLTIVRRLVEMHDGVVEAASDGPGLGTVFTVRLPTVAAPAPAAPALPPASDVRTRRIVLVEDDPDTRELLQQSLEVFGHEVDATGDPERAVQLVIERRPDAVILDIGLPGGVTGYDVARRIRAEGRTVLLIALTGYGQAEDERRSLEAGFDRHLVKPIDPAALNQLLGGGDSPAG